jgi:hypothetical protein
MSLASVVRIGLVLAVVAGRAPAYAQEPTAEPSAEPKAFACTFEEGMTWSYDDHAFVQKPPAALKFEITDIDLDGQSAQLLTEGREKPGALKIVRAINANHFLEVVNEGFLNLTTVYDKDPASGRHPAVHSRHFGLLGQPVFAQYAGFCTQR